ncbi:MAG TPA: hypothetical protein V6C71_05985 [Coleofasciculaceae cyanobacterium]
MGKLSLAQRFIQASHSINSSLLSDSPTTKAKILLSLGNINKCDRATLKRATRLS